ncbi:MAG: hypothetical protein JSR44_03970 [Spirochaetes bacterium]|nr:hypothetical protein [Spirochaetota bacterium]
MNCTNELPISDLLNSTISLKFLGTYESNDPNPQQTLPLDDIFVAGSGITNASPAISNTTQAFLYGSNNDAASQGAGLTAGISGSRLVYYMDIAEIRIAQGQGQSSGQSISSYWNQFAITRELLASNYTTTDGQAMMNAKANNATQNLYDFFNGGFKYPAVDLPSGTYNNLGIYFRRLNIGPGAVFNGDGSYYGGTQSSAESSATAVFDNRAVYAVDVESYLQSPYNQTPATPLLFPLQRFDLAVSVQNDHEPYVLEVRVFLQNALQVFFKQLTNNASVPTDPSNAAAIFAAPGDWNTNYAYADVNNNGKMGGSLMMTARTYQPRYVGSIQMSATVGSGSDYFAVVPTGTPFGIYNGGVQWNNTPSAVSNATLPLIATRGSNTLITNIPPGTYDVYRTCDIYKCTISSTPGYCDGTTGKTIFLGGPIAPDGYPETAVLCQSGVTITSSTTTPVLITACSSAVATATNPCFSTGYN